MHTCGLVVYARPLKKKLGVHCLALWHFHKLKILRASHSAVLLMESWTDEYSFAGRSVRMAHVNDDKWTSKQLLENVGSLSSATEMLCQIKENQPSHHECKYCSRQLKVNSRIVRYAAYLILPLIWFLKSCTKRKYWVAGKWLPVCFYKYLLTTSIQWRNKLFK